MMTQKITIGAGQAAVFDRADALTMTPEGGTVVITAQPVANPPGPDPEPEPGPEPAPGLAILEVKPIDKIVNVADRRIVCPTGKIQSLRVEGGRNLLFKDLDLMPVDGFALDVVGGDGITMDDLRFQGTGPKGGSKGYQVTRCRNVTGTNLSFRGLVKSAVHEKSDHIKLLKGTVFENREGLNFSETRFLEIGDYLFGDFTWEGKDHPDCLQFWTTGDAYGNEDVHIHDCHQLPGSKRTAQFILMGNNNPDKPHLRYKRVLIENVSSMSDFGTGIAVHSPDDCTIRNAVCVGNPAGTVKASIAIYGGAGKIAIENSIAQAIVIGAGNSQGGKNGNLTVPLSDLVKHIDLNTLVRRAA